MNACQDFPTVPGKWNDLLKSVTSLPGDGKMVAKIYLFPPSNKMIQSPSQRKTKETKTAGHLFLLHFDVLKDSRRIENLWGVTFTGSRHDMC